MKKIITSCLIVLSVQTVKAQQLQLTDINLIGGRNFSNFLFKDSEGNKDNSLDYEALSTYSVNFNFKSGCHILRPELSFRQSGAKSMYEGTALSWKLNYLDVSIAYLYSLLNSERFVVAPGIGLSSGYMLTGDQYIGGSRYSIKDSKSLKPFDFCFQGLAHFGMNITDNFSLSLEYRFGLGIAQIENDVNAQKSRNIYNSALLGLGIRLK
jgi:hypothetical protein